MLELNSISLLFSGKIILNDINLKLQPGEKYLITGKSGAGKSSLAKIISGCLSPTNGSVFLNKKNITNVSNSNIILVHQEDDLFPWLKVEEQIKIGICENPIISAHSMLEKLGLNGSEKLWPHELSGGMKKRLALGRALMLNPKVLILDETFSSLDQNLRSQIYQDLISIIPPGTITIFIAHDIIEMSVLNPIHLKLVNAKLIN